MVFHFTTQHYEGVYNTTGQDGRWGNWAGTYENSHRWLCTILWDSAFQNQTNSGLRETKIKGRLI
jgi:hypothetical protein